MYADNARLSEIATAIVATLESRGETWGSHLLTLAGVHPDHPDRERAWEVLQTLQDQGVVEYRWERGKVLVALV